MVCIGGLLESSTEGLAAGRAQRGLQDGASVMVSSGPFCGPARDVRRVSHSIGGLLERCCERGARYAPHDRIDDPAKARRNTGLRAIASSSM
jgi:hypothetical protein